MSFGYRTSTGTLGLLGMNFIGIFYFLSCFLMSGIQVAVCDGSAGWRSGPPDGLPELTKLSVECGKEEMTVYLEFSAPYDGTVYSKSNGQSSRCVHVPSHSRITHTTFSVDYDSCGTRSDPHGKFYENTVVIQYDDVVIEAWDEAKKIRCEWHDGYEKSAYKTPIAISDLDVVEMNFQGDDVDCWLEVQDGKGPWSAKVEGLVPLGSPLTLVVAIQDSEGYFDMRVKSCIAHDGQKHPIHLTDEDGCVLRPKMMTPFQKTTETKGTASVIAYSHFYAFKFPETVEVTIQCTVEICRHGCPGTCLESRDSQPPQSLGGIEYHQPPVKEGDDIPTYKDSFPFSTIVTSRPDQQNYSSTLNTSSNTIQNTVVNSSKEDSKDPLEVSPNTHHDFYLNHYPYDLFDDLMAEDRQDGKVEYDDHSDKEFAGDGVYYSQLPGLYRDRNENGKNFPSAQKIHFLSNETIPETTTQATLTTENELLPPTEAYIMTTLPNLNEVTTLTVQMGMHTSTTEPEENTTQDPTEGPSSEEEETSTDGIYTTIVNGNVTSTEDTQSRHGNPKENSIREVSVSTQPTAGTSEIFVEPADYNEALVENGKDPDYDFGSNRKHSEDKMIYQDYDFQKDRVDDKIKDLPEVDYDDYRARARKPSDSFETRQNYHYQYHQGHAPLALAPPITLYNGVPLQYYYSNNNQPNREANFMDRNGHPYLSKYPYQKDHAKSYVKSKLRRPGRRGRRDIGENEQLGLKQTLRVIATTDFDYFSKDEVKPQYVGAKDLNMNVCMAPSSLAAGLGLLLLANVCVLCVVVFLGHHYYVHRKKKGKTVELLDTEMS